MKLFGDFHVHTNFSGDGKQSVADVVSVAEKMGLSQIGFTDHGFCHMAYGTNRKNQEKLREQLSEQSTKVQLFLGIEANIRSFDGTIDLQDDDLKNLDYVVCGYHKTTKPKTFKDVFCFNLPGIVGKKRFSQKRIAEQTKAYVSAIKSGKIDILAHPGYCLPIFVEEVGKACVDYGVAIELNGKRISLSDEEIVKLYSLGAKFVVNSDAHTIERVGEVSLPLACVERLHIQDAVLNVDKLVSFKKR